MREATFADPVDVAIKRYERAAESLKKVMHYTERDFMGRGPTSSELQDISTRTEAVAAALHAVCAAPCADFKVLRRKVKFLGVYLLTSDGLRGYDQRAFVQSILQMYPKNAGRMHDAEG